MKKGVSLVALVTTIVIMLILITVVTISGNKMSNNTKKTNFATEINSIQKAVDSYLEKNEDDYPILNNIIINLSNVSDENRLQFTSNGDKIINNIISLFEIDYEKIGYTDLKYGNKKDGENDIYVLSAITGKVYYVKGFKTNNKVYYTLTEELQKSLEYKTTDTNVNNSNSIISYVQNDLEDSQKKVTVKIPISYTVTSVKVGNTSYNSSTTDQYNIYEVVGMSGTVIDITYTYDGYTKSTSYMIK